MLLKNSIFCPKLSIKSISIISDIYFSWPYRFSTCKISKTRRTLKNVSIIQQYLPQCHILGPSYLKDKRNVMVQNCSKVEVNHCRPPKMLQSTLEVSFILGLKKNTWILPNFFISLTIWRTIMSYKNTYQGVGGVESYFSFFLQFFILLQR